MSPRYTPLSHEDSDDELSPQEHLLSVSSMNSRYSGNRSSTTLSATLHPAFVFRSISLALGIIAFIIFIVDGHGPFIATDIFLAFTMILDSSMIVHHAFTQVFEVSIQLRNGSWKSDVRGSHNSNGTRFVDIGLALCLTISLITGNAVRAGHPGIWIISAIFGYLIIIIHILLAVPSLHKSNLVLTVSAKLIKKGGETAEDSENLVQPAGTAASSDAGSVAGSTRRRTPDDDEPRQPVQDLV